MFKSSLHEFTGFSFPSPDKVYSPPKKENLQMNKLNFNNL